MFIEHLFFNEQIWKHFSYLSNNPSGTVFLPLNLQPTQIVARMENYHD